MSTTTRPTDEQLIQACKKWAEARARYQIALLACEDCRTGQLRLEQERDSRSDIEHAAHQEVLDLVTALNTTQSGWAPSVAEAKP